MSKDFTEIDTDTPKGRLLAFCRMYGLSSNREIEKLLELGNGYFRTPDKGMNTGTLCKIAKRYPTLNLNWLICGCGHLQSGQYLVRGRKNHGRSRIARSVQSFRFCLPFDKRRCPNLRNPRSLLPPGARIASSPLVDDREKPAARPRGFLGQDRGRKPIAGILAGRIPACRSFLRCADTVARRTRQTPAARTPYRRKPSGADGSAVSRPVGNVPLHGTSPRQTTVPGLDLHPGTNRCFLGNKGRIPSLKIPRPLPRDSKSNTACS